MGVPTVLIGGLPAAVVGSPVMELIPSEISTGAATVIIGGSPAQ
jgi:uncharacterized Zn-binding protein involved in type VI secretion